MRPLNPDAKAGATPDRNFFAGWQKTRQKIFAPFPVAANDLEGQIAAIEEGLILADCQIETAAKIAAETRAAALANPQFGDALAVAQAVVARKLRPLDAAIAFSPAPFVLLVLGVNGGGKTTTVAKIARLLAVAGKKTLVAAGDTFRAAAREQLAGLTARLESDPACGGRVEFFRGGQDPAAVAFDAATKACARGFDVAVIDTAGRLPNHPHLLAELQKIVRAIGKALPGAPHERLLVLDGTLGGAAITQTEIFSAAIGVTGLAVAKMDGSSKGGFLLALSDRPRPPPVRYIGVGEDLSALAPFHADTCAAALLARD